MTAFIKIGVPAGLRFEALQLRVIDTGEIDFAPEPIHHIAAANGLPDPPRESAIEMIAAWYAALRRGGYRNSAAELYFHSTIDWNSWC